MNASFPAEVQTIIATIERCGFGIDLYEENGVVCGAEIESWTVGGVDMIHFIDLRGKDINDPADWKEEIASIAADFDVDEEIEVYRQDKRYCDAFTCRASVEDFEGWQERLRSLAQAVLYPEIEEESHEPPPAADNTDAVTLKEVAEEYLKLCDNDCCGDDSVGVPCCRFYFFPDVLDDRPMLGRCRLRRYAGEEGSDYE